MLKCPCARQGLGTCSGLYRRIGEEAAARFRPDAAGAKMEVTMDRRLFLAGLFGAAGAATLASVVKPVEAVAGVPGPGILDELNDPIENDLEAGPESAEPELVWHRGYRHYGPRRRRGWRWRTICRRYWHRGRWRRRCVRRRVSFWIHL